MCTMQRKGGVASALLLAQPNALLPQHGHIQVLLSSACSTGASLPPHLSGWCIPAFNFSSITSGKRLLLSLSEAGLV